MEWFLHGRNRGPRFASRSRHPKRPGLLRQPCHRGLKSANPPAPPVPRPTGTTPAPTTWRLPMSFVPCTPHLQPILSSCGTELQRQIAGLPLLVAPPQPHLSFPFLPIPLTIRIVLT